MSEQGQGRWYEGITRYQWLVLAIASLGWVFDVFEGQIFVASMNEAMPSLAADRLQDLDATERRGQLAFYNNVTFGAFLLGGALGGVVFGMMSDRIGRKKAMNVTILTYSAFTFLSSWSSAWWDMALFRFLVALGVGGEWAVASALVAEVFPKRARAWSLAIFHASSVLGTYLAIGAGFFIVAGGPLQVTLPLLGGPWKLESWRVGFALGAVPALLIIWIRRSLREPDSWQQARAEAAEHHGRQLGGITELFRPPLLGRTGIGVGLAAVGLATFWGVHIYGKDLLRAEAERAGQASVQADELPDAKVLKRWEMAGMFLVTTGGGLGLVSFGPLCEWLGRRGAFLLFHLGGFAATVILLQGLRGVTAVASFLPVFGFLTLGMHAGYAVYFPELFPTRLRSTGGGFCFNVGRVVAAGLLFANGWVQWKWELRQTDAATLLGLLFLAGAVLLLPAPETRGQELPK